MYDTQRGFTLIELLVVIAIMSMLAVVGIAAFVRYSQSQVLLNVTQQVATSLQSARSRSQTQVKPPPPVCSDTQPLYGYSIYVQDSTYQLVVNCGTPLMTIDKEADKDKLLTNCTYSQNAVLEKHTLPAGIKFGVENCLSFPVLTTNLVAIYPSILLIGKNNLQRNIDLDEGGNISISDERL